MTTQLVDTASVKRKSACSHASSGSSAAESHSKHERKSSRRTYEFVRIAPIASWIHKVLPSKAIDPVRQFCAMVALCGCDFARNLPRLGPRTLWKLRHRLQHTDLLQAPQVVSALSIAYSDLFVTKNAVPAGMRNNIEWFQSMSDEQVCVIYNDVAARIQGNNKLSERIKMQLWGADIAMAHARNTVWTMHYWSFLDHCPDPHAADFGYVRDAKGRTHFAAQHMQHMDVD
jgi:hypothetical protein